MNLGKHKYSVYSSLVEMKFPKTKTKKGGVGGRGRKVVLERLQGSF